MRVAVDSIPEDGRTVEVTSATPWAVDVVRSVLAGATGAVSGSLVLRRQKRRIDVGGDVVASGLTPCERCGEDVDLELHARVELVYLPATAGKAATAEEVRLELSDLDLGWYEGESLDLSQVLSEALALALPPRVICADQSACEARTEALLGAAREEPTGHPALAALRDLL